jgi:N-acyl-D-amino-acid deacylase
VITEVGSVADGSVSSGKRELNADGLLVTPGFVDIHTHYDAQVTWDEQLSPSSWHGVTTVVMGNCGVGFAPAARDRHEWLIGLMEGVEDIPGAAMTEGIQWNWESFPEYLNAIDTPHAIDYGTQIPHGALRGYVMGDRGAANEASTADDVQQMYTLVKEALEAGALGFSTSRTMLHKAIDGRPVPGTFAGEDEVFGIGRALQDVGRGVFQMAAQHENVPEELGWARRLANQTGRPVMFNLSQVDQDPELWREGMRLLDDAGKAGVPLFAQVAGRAIGIVMSFHLTAHPFATHPSWLQIMHKTKEEKRAAIKDPAFRAKLLSEKPLKIGEFETFVTTTFSKMFPLAAANGAPVNYEPEPSECIAAQAARLGKTPQEIAYDILAQDDTEGMLYFPLFNYADGNLDLLEEMHSHPRTLMGLSDAGAHCGAICDGGMPTFMLTHWTRDRTRGRKFQLEEIVRRQTSATAQAYGLNDRGIIAPGMRADINLIDYENLNFSRPEVRYDLPAGGRRLVQRATGYEATMVLGELIAQGGKPTGALPGRLIRGARPNPRR